MTSIWMKHFTLVFFYLANLYLHYSHMILFLSLCIYHYHHKQFTIKFFTSQATNIFPIFSYTFLTVVLTKSDKRTRPKIFWKLCFVWLVCFPLRKECNIPPFFLQAEACRSGEAWSSVVLVEMSIYDSRLTFLFLVGAEGTAYFSILEEFSRQVRLIEGGLLLTPGVKVVTSTAKCGSLQKILIALELFYHYLSTWIFTGKNFGGQ